MPVRPMLIVVGAALLLAACVPPPAPPPPPDPSITPASCDTQATPTPSKPVTYAAVVDTPGPTAPTVVTFTATSQQDKDQQVKNLQTTGTVLAVEQDKPVAAQNVAPNDDPNYSAQWGLAAANFPTAWANGLDGTGVRIAIVDTGIDGTHEDLTGHVDTGRDFVANPPPSTGASIPAGINSDQNGHGTHVAGIAAALDNTKGGVGGAPNATLVPVRVLNQNGSGTDAAVAAGIIWAADPTKGNAQVINLSLGGSGCSTTIEAALEYAVCAQPSSTPSCAQTAPTPQQHVVVVAAAGNSASTDAFTPAAYNGEVIAVAALDSAGNLASYSNYGSYVDIAAPGGTGSSNSTSILSTWPPSLTGGAGQPSLGTKYTTLNGTSMASPLVAAAAALILQKCPGILPDALQTKLLTYAGSAVAPHYTFRRLDIGAATTAAC